MLQGRKLLQVICVNVLVMTLYFHNNILFACYTKVVFAVELTSLTA